jgi:ectoine hydroxylase-related dioxygenase (phytanoyl-CoA dioxygenase family)
MNHSVQLSTEIARLAKEIVEGRGYILLPNLLTSSEAKNARDLVLELADRERSATGKLVNHNNKERLYGLINKGEIFEKMVQHPQVLSVIEAILGEEVILGGFSAHILHANAPRMGVHVDYPYWAMNSPYPKHPILEVQVIWMVEDFTDRNGAPLFVPESQKLATKPDLEKFEQTAQKITGGAGTAIIAHGLCWHDTSVNSTDNPRVSILGNYIPEFIHPLEDSLYDMRSDAIDRATPKLKQLLRHQLKSNSEQTFKMTHKMRYSNN